MRVDALFDASLRREPLAERAHVGVPEGLALERAEERMPAGESDPLPTLEPAVDGVGRVRGQRGGARLVALAVEHAERAAGRVEVLRVERQGFRDAEPGAEEHRQQGAVADTGRRAPRAGGAERLYVAKNQGLRGEPAAGLSSHSYETVPGPVQCRFV